MSDTDCIDTRLTDSTPIEPSSRYGCGSDACVDCYGNYAWRQANCLALFDNDQTCEWCGEYPESLCCDEAPDGCHYPGEEYDFVLN